jgi:hypothetical protein
LIPEPGTPEELAVFLRAEAEKWKRVIEIAAIKID